jgi:hypothetical protein
MASYDLEPSGPVYHFAFENVTLSTAGPSDLFCITAPSNSRVVVREIRLGQFSEFGDAQSELLSLRFLFGSTSVSSGATVTGANVQRHTGAPSAGSSVLAPSTTVASSASAAGGLADSWNVAGGWYYKPEIVERPVLAPGTRFALRQSTPNDAVSLNGTIVLQEIGRIA